MAKIQSTEAQERALKCIEQTVRILKKMKAFDEACGNDRQLQIMGRGSDGKPHKLVVSDAEAPVSELIQNFRKNLIATAVKTGKDNKLDFDDEEKELLGL